MGLTVLPPDVNHSLDRFVLEDGNIRFGFRLALRASARAPRRPS